MLPNASDPLLVGPKLNALPGTILFVVFNEIGSGVGEFLTNDVWPGFKPEPIPEYDWKPNAIFSIKKNELID